MDVMTGYRAFSPMFVKSFPIMSEGFEIETEMTIHALDKNLLLTSIPVAYRDRPDGSESKLNTYTDGTKVLFTIFNLYRDYRPLRFFGAVSAMLMLLFVLMMIPVLSDYFHTGLVPRFPTLIVAGFFCLSGLIALACGLVLDTIAKNNRKNAELQMNIVKILSDSKDIHQ